MLFRSGDQGVRIDFVEIVHQFVVTAPVSAGFPATLGENGKTYIGVHGDYDAFSKSGVSSLCMSLGFLPYAITFGHMHTCSVDETNSVKMIRGGSLAGCGDSYTIEKRLTGKPSQMVCICTNKGVRAYCPIELH